MEDNAMIYEAMQRVNQDGWFIRAVDKAVLAQYPWLCETAILCATHRISDTESILHHIPKEHLTPELCAMAIEHDGCAIRDVPSELLTYDLCLKAVSNKGSELISVPRHFKDKALIKAAVEENGIAIGAVHPSQITEELCWLAMKTAPYHFCYLPERYMTWDLYVYAQRRYPAEIKCIPDAFFEKYKENRGI